MKWVSFIYNLSCCSNILKIEDIATDQKGSCESHGLLKIEGIQKKRPEKMGGPGPPSFKVGGAMAHPAPPVPTPLSCGEPVNTIKNTGWIYL